MFKKLERIIAKLNRDERGIFDPQTVNIFVASGSCDGNSYSDIFNYK